MGSPPPKLNWNIIKEDEKPHPLLFADGRGVLYQFQILFNNIPAPRVKRHRLRLQWKPTFPLTRAATLPCFASVVPLLGLGSNLKSRFSPSTIYKKRITFCYPLFICRWSGSNRHVVAYTRF